MSESNKTEIEPYDVINFDFKTINKQDYVKNKRSRKLKRNDSHNRRSATESPHGGVKGKHYTGNRGKVKPNSTVGGCPYCQIRVNNSRSKMLEVKLEAVGYYDEKI